MTLRWPCRNSGTISEPEDLARRSLVTPPANIRSRRPTRFFLPSFAFELTLAPVIECALSSEPHLLHNRLAERMKWTDEKTGVTPAARPSFVPETTRELLSPCRCILHVLSSVLAHTKTGKQSSIHQVVATGRRRCADMLFPRNSNNPFAMWLLDQTDEQASHSCGSILHDASVTEAIGR